MLVEFTVGNYRSFKEPVTFSLVATDLVAKDKSLDENNVISVSKELRLLKSAVIYGANASGKSNLAKALDFMLDFIVNSSRATQSTDEISVTPFRLSTITEKQPSFFELVISIDNVLYRYGFEVTHNRVVSEWLYHTRKRESRLFERKEGDIQISTVFGGKQIRKFTRDNALFLSVAAQFNIQTADKILSHIKSRIAIVSGLYDEDYENWTVYFMIHQLYDKEIVDMIKRLDLSIEGIEVETVQLSSDMLPQDWPEELKEATINFNKGKAGVFNFLHKKEADTTETVDQLERFAPEQESEGTQKLFTLAGLLVHALKTSMTLVIDEFDARLHPLITQEILRFFNSPVSNPEQAQLICMTHDINLLSHKLLRRDQIWFTEKTGYGATDLYSLAEYQQVRNDASFESDYIKGRYGAIPYVRELEALFSEKYGQA